MFLSHLFPVSRLTMAFRWVGLKLAWNQSEPPKQPCTQHPSLPVIVQLKAESFQGFWTSTKQDVLEAWRWWKKSIINRNHILLWRKRSRLKFRLKLHFFLFLFLSLFPFSFSFSCFKIDYVLQMGGSETGLKQCREVIDFKNCEARRCYDAGVKGVAKHALHIVILLQVL